LRIKVPLVAAALVVVGCGGQGPEESISTDALNPNNYSADVTLSFNEMIVDIGNAEDGFFTLKTARTLAMMHIAAHDALNGIEGKYDQYAYHGSINNAHPIAAAAQATYDVAVYAYPGSQAALQAELNLWLATVPNGNSKNKGIQIGHAAANAIIAERVGDNWDAPGSYTFQPPAPGVYQTYPPFDGFVFGAGWGLATPFTMNSQSQFRPPPPPSVNSGLYTAAYNHVKSVGSLNSTTRTADQTHLAFWWREFTEGSMNRLGRQLADAENLNLWKATRMFAQLNMNMFDGYVSTFESKFFYNHWRPITAIHEGDNDGNPNTVGDPTWENVAQFTPPFPTYGSAHSTVCATSMRVFGKTFGDRYDFTMETNTALPGDPTTRDFKRFSLAAVECGASRVFLGYHFAYDSAAGLLSGTLITEHASNHYLED
jgi:hypothetical protein